ncbi:GAF domain-containing protein [Brachybacterium phenoliresistens]|nr:GAF domain-containing protein [Brachybacterium phenoliresistens]
MERDDRWPLPTSQVPMMRAPGSPVEDAYQAQLLRAHAELREGNLPAGQDRPGMVRRAVLESWRRSLSRLQDHPTVPSRPVLAAPQLESARSGHLFGPIMPLLRSRLIAPAVEAGMLVALGDAQGRLLWVEGPSAVRTRAESMGFAPGADWSEEAMGTSAPALALATGSPVQVVGAEHFVEAVHPWSCSAVPVLHPRSGEVIGVIDVTGDVGAVAPIVLPLLRSTALAAQEELRALLAPGAASRPGRTGAGAVEDEGAGHGTGTDHRPLLQVMGPGAPRLRCGGRDLELSGRHAELLLLLHLHPDGIRGAELAEQLHGDPRHEGTVRAEVVRLRRLLGAGGPGPDGRALPEGSRPGIASRPYRLLGEVDSDLRRVRQALDRADVAALLDAHRGPLLTASDAPAVVRAREELAAHVREVVLEHASAEQLWRYAQRPEGAGDAEVLMTVLALAPPDAPERSAAVVRLEALRREAG